MNTTQKNQQNGSDLGISDRLLKTRLKTIVCSHSLVDYRLAEDNIFQAIDLVLFIKKMADHSRKVTEIEELYFDGSEKKSRRLFHFNSSSGPMNAPIPRTFYLPREKSSIPDEKSLISS